MVRVHRLYICVTYTHYGILPIHIPIKCCNHCGQLSASTVFCTILVRIVRSCVAMNKLLDKFFANLYIHFTHLHTHRVLLFPSLLLFEMYICMGVLVHFAHETCNAICYYILTHIYIHIHALCICLFLWEYFLSL